MLPAGDSSIDKEIKYPVDCAEPLPTDPILTKGNRVKKQRLEGKSVINGVIGVIADEDGKVLPLPIVQKSIKAQSKKNIQESVYLPMRGEESFGELVAKLVFGENSKLLKEKRVAIAQGMGGSGALRLGAEVIEENFKQLEKRYGSEVKRITLISDPAWINYHGIFGRVMPLDIYPYYDRVQHKISTKNMLQKLSTMPRWSVVVLQACCHNPSGSDLNSKQWDDIRSVVKERSLIPFFDVAYHGFGKDLESDLYPVRSFADADIPLYVAYSFSKNAGLYNQRLGALLAVTPNEKSKNAIESFMSRAIRTMYSSPPQFGASVMTDILSDPKMFSQWEKQLAKSRRNMNAQRKLLVEVLSDVGMDASHVKRGAGMFTLLDFTDAEIQYLEEKWGVFMLEGIGRFSVCAINSKNQGQLRDAFKDVLVKRK